MKKFIVSTVLLICFSCVANAQEIEDIKKCSLINDPMKRLACFDALVKDESESPKDEVKPVVAKVEPKEIDLVVEEDVSKSSEEIIEGQQEKIVSLERRIKRITRQRDVEKQKNEDKYQSFSATVVSASLINYKFRFKLDNGETWQLTDSVRRAGLKKGETIRIVPGEMRSFFLESSKGRFRVKKIK